MSYDISLVADLGGPELISVGDLEVNMTWNLRPMFAAANGGNIGPQEWDGQKAGIVALLLRQTLAAFYAEPAKFQALNPPNGWGSYSVAIECADKVLTACERAPFATVSVT